MKHDPSVEHRELITNQSRMKNHDHRFHPCAPSVLLLRTDKETGNTPSCQSRIGGTICHSVVFTTVTSYGGNLAGIPVDPESRKVTQTMGSNKE